MFSVFFSVFSAACEIEKTVIKENELEKKENERLCGRAFQRAGA